MDQRELTALFVLLLSSKPGGMGLGLAYSNYLVNKMGGNLEVNSEPGKGTSITLRFQISPTDAKPNEDDEQND